MFYILDFSTHYFVSADYPEQAIAMASMLMTSGAGNDDIEIVAAFDDEQRFTPDEFEERWS